jgi:hypothetical protein
VTYFERNTKKWEKIFWLIDAFFELREIIAVIQRAVLMEKNLNFETVVGVIDQDGRN